MISMPAPTLYRLRSISAQDGAALTRFYAELSPDSRALRFHGGGLSIPDGTATFFCGPDHEHREGIVAESFERTGQPTIIGHLCLEPADGETAEMAIAIADAWQHHGVGRALLEQAIGWARAHGFARLLASMLGGNTGMALLLGCVGYPITYSATVGDTVDAYLDLRHPRPLAA
jgi:acetyltransferase